MMFLYFPESKSELQLHHRIELSTSTPASEDEQQCHITLTGISTYVCPAFKEGSSIFILRTLFLNFLYCLLFI